MGRYQDLAKSHYSILCLKAIQPTAASWKRLLTNLPMIGSLQVGLISAITFVIPLQSNAYCASSSGLKVIVDGITLFFCQRQDRVLSYVSHRYE